MRGLILSLVISAMVAGCSCQGTGITGRADADAEVREDPVPEPEEEPGPTCWDSDGDGHEDEECGGDDCDDSDPDVYPGAPEVCLDGVDQDCDTVVDGLTKMLEDVRITNDSQASSFPSIAWTGSEYAVAWNDGRDGIYNPYLVRISGDGAVVGSEILISDTSATAWYPSVAWTGSELGVGWEEGGDVWFARLTPEGSPIGSVVMASRDAGRVSFASSVLWTGSEFAVFFPEEVGSDSWLKMVRLNPDGTYIIDSELELASLLGDWPGFPSAVWTGSEYGLSWHSERDGEMDVSFMAFVPEDVPGATEVRITDNPGSSMYPDLAWTGSELGLIYHDEVDGRTEIFLSRISSDGSPLGTSVRLTEEGQSRRPDLVWTGSEFGVSWDDDRDGNLEIYFRLVSADAVMMGPEMRITNADEMSRDVGLVWTGSEIGLTWHDHRNAAHNSEIYFNRLGFCE